MTTTTENRAETGLGAAEKDYNEILDALKAAGGPDLQDKFENMIADVANHCYDRAAAEALGGAVIDGSGRVFGSEASSQRECAS